MAKRISEFQNDVLTMDFRADRALHTPRQDILIALGPQSHSMAPENLLCHVEQNTRRTLGLEVTYLSAVNPAQSPLAAMTTRKGAAGCCQCPRALPL